MAGAVRAGLREGVDRRAVPRGSGGGWSAPVLERAWTGERCHVAAVESGPRRS